MTNDIYDFGARIGASLVIALLIVGLLSPILQVYGDILPLGSINCNGDATCAILSPVLEFVIPVMVAFFAIFSLISVFGSDSHGYKNR